MNAEDDRSRELYRSWQEASAHRGAEIVRGVLHRRPRADLAHAAAVSALVGQLSLPFQRARGGPGGSWILCEAELHLVPFEPLVADLAAWRVERMPSLPVGAHLGLVPDWICEVLSPPSATLVRTEKLPVYAAVGVGHVWLVDPAAHRLEIYLLGEEGCWREVTVHEGDERVRAAPFAAIELELDALWTPPRSA